MMRIEADQYISPTQHGFRPKRQASEVHHLLGKIREMGQEWRVKYIVLKVDVKKAFDSLHRSAIMTAMQHIKVHPRIIWGLSRDLLANKMQPQLYGTTSPAPIVATNGVKQGSPESGMLFCLTVSHFCRPIAEEWARRGFGHRVGFQGEAVNHVSFADDIQLIAKTPAEISTMYGQLTDTLAPIGLQVNPAKTQYITNLNPESCKGLPGANQTGEGMVVLGRLFDNTDTTDRDFSRKEAQAWGKYRRMLPVLKQRSSLRHRLRILQACVLQTILWGSETWIPTKRRTAHMREFT